MTARGVNVSLDDDERAALVSLARGQRYGRVSAAVAALIRDEARRQFGDNWRDVVRAETCETDEPVGV